MMLANFAFIGLSYRYFDGCENVEESEAWSLLAITTAATLISGAVAYYYVPETHKRTFHQHYTFKQHLATYFWDEKKSTYDSKHRVFENQDAVRAIMVSSFSMHYLPKRKLMDLFNDKWSVWEKDPPIWFDDDYRKSVPKELLEELVK